MSDEVVPPTDRIPVQRRSSASAATAERPCRCGHPPEAHHHLRPGTHCAICGCAHYRSAARLADQLVAVLDRGP